MRTITAAAIVLALLGAPVGACEYDTPTDWLPGFTKEQQEVRSGEILRARSTVDMYLRVERNMDIAPVVYLARVLQTDYFRMSKSVYHASIQPLKALKGEMPKARQLSSSPMSSCGWADGDGDATFARQGELVVVFEGLPLRQEIPRGIDSVRMINVRYGSLLDPVQEWLSSQPEYPGPL